MAAANLVMPEVVDETLIDQEAAAIARIERARAILGDDVVILGHHYQRDEVVRFADFRGDSSARKEPK